MRSRMLVSTGTALLLAASMGFAAQEDPITFKKYMIKEEFKLVEAFTPREKHILGEAGEYVVIKSDVERMLAYYPLQTQKRLQENHTEMSWT